MRHRPATTAVAAAPLAVVLLLAGCSSAGSPGATSSASSASSAPRASRSAAPTAAVAAKPLPSNPCDLLSAAAAGKAVGTTFSAPFRAGNACTYDQEEHGFSLTVYTQGEDSWQAALIGMKAQFGKTPSVGGLGDRAVGTGGILSVQSGSTVFTVSDDYADKDPGLVHAIAVAKVVLGDL